MTHHALLIHTTQDGLVLTDGLGRRVAGCVRSIGITTSPEEFTVVTIELVSSPVSFRHSDESSPLALGHLGEQFQEVAS